MEFPPKKATTTKKCCSVPQCSSLAERDRTLSFHTFPKENETVRVSDRLGNYAATGRRTEWARLLKIGKPVSKCMYVCSKHFTADNFRFPDVPAQRRYLKFDAVPSENLPQSPTKGQSVHTTRHLDRRKKRLPDSSLDNVPQRSLNEEGSEEACQVEVKAKPLEDWTPPPPIVFIKTEITDDGYAGVCHSATGLDLIAASSYSAAINLGLDPAATTKSEADRPDFRFVDVGQTVHAPSTSGQPTDVDPLELADASLAEPSIKQEQPDDSQGYALVPTPHCTPTDRGVISSSSCSRLTSDPVIATTPDVEQCGSETHRSANETNGIETLAFETGKNRVTSRLPSQGKALFLNTGLGSTEHASSQDVRIKTSGGKRKDVRIADSSTEQNDVDDGKPWGCEQSVDKTNQPASHKLVRTEAKRFGCRFCPAQFVKKSNLAVHLRSHTGEKPFPCYTYKARYLHRISLVKHKRTHAEQKRYTCNSCEASFDQESDLVDHKQTHESHVCDICQATFTQTSSLKKHKRVHTGVKPYTCDSCEARFSLHFHLTQHMRTHTGAKPYVCNVCGAKFTQSSHLIGHRRVHTGEKPYSCTACVATFSVARSLRLHRVKRHAATLTEGLEANGPRLRPHRCLECNSTFTNSWQLARHGRLHAREKTYVCEVCSARFSEASDLTNHRRSQKHTKIYSCDVCNATFTHGGSLAMHKRLHTVAKPNVCD